MVHRGRCCSVLPVVYSPSPPVTSARAAARPPPRGCTPRLPVASTAYTWSGDVLVKLPTQVQGDPCERCDEPTRHSRPTHRTPAPSNYRATLNSSKLRTIHVLDVLGARLLVVAKLLRVHFELGICASAPRFRRCLEVLSLHAQRLACLHIAQELVNCGGCSSTTVGA